MSLITLTTVQWMTHMYAHHPAKGQTKHEPVSMSILSEYSKLTSELSHICWELFSKLSFSPQPNSDWHLNKAASILERIDISIAIFSPQCSSEIWPDTPFLDELRLLHLLPDCCIMESEQVRISCILFGRLCVGAICSVLLILSISEPSAHIDTCFAYSSTGSLSWGNI